ncbi:MAG: hypothetical protein JSV56_13035 [Methanomassiliicoccales archaeon]|nr:MAG: hypothetical protein JSV56_13035 [Methanomassiliicoccales archaeon]
MRKALTFATVFNMIILAALGCSVAGQPAGDTEVMGNTIYFERIKQEENVSEPQPINLYLNGGDGGELRAEVPEGNSTTEVDCPGHPVSRRFGYYIGTWTTPQLTAAITLGAKFSTSLWVYSTEGASNVRFRVQIFINGDQKYDFFTESSSVSSTPVEIRGEGNHDETLELQAGDTLGVRYAYFSDPKYFVGPGANSKLLVGGDEYDSHLTVITSPITVSVKSPGVTDTLVIFSATYTDAFASTKLNAHIMVDGKVEVATLSDPTFAPGVNGSSVSWQWDYITDKGRDGEYQITVFICYSEENEFMAQGAFTIVFPKSDEGGGIFDEMGWLLPVIIVVVIIAVVAVALKFILARRSAMASEA